MIALQYPQQPYPDISSYIGIAIQGDEEQRHIGILFRTNTDDEPKLLHLAFHQRLRCEDSTYYAKDYHWLLCPGFSEDEQLQLAVWCETIYSQNGSQIPYGLTYSLTGYFQQNGIFKPSEIDCGLTCATFIMALFEDFGFKIIDTQSWPCRTDDEVWHNNIIKAMKCDQERHPELYSQSHIAAQETHIGLASRFRPEEVAASAHVFTENPLKLEDAEPIGQNLLSKLLSCRNNMRV